MEGIIIDGVLHASWLGIPIGIVHAIIAGVIAIVIEMIRQQKTEIAETKKLVEEVKATAEKTRATGEDTHTLTNSNMGVQLECAALAFRQVVELLQASPTATPERIATAIEKAEKAERLLQEHNKQQAVVDAGLIIPTPELPRAKVSDE